ncbi:MAG: hypothetical protein R3F14_22525 [Polyangiaceae bacterium]
MHRPGSNTEPRVVHLTFMYVTGSEDAVDYVAFPANLNGVDYSTAIDLSSAPRPTSISVTTAEAALSVSVTDIAIGDRAGYWHLLRPAPGGTAASSGCSCGNPGAGTTGGSAGSAGSSAKAFTGNASWPGPSWLPPPPAEAEWAAPPAWAENDHLHHRHERQRGAGGQAALAARGGVGGTGAGGTSGGGTGAAGGAECVSDLTPPTDTTAGVCNSCDLQQGEPAPGELYQCGKISSGTSGLAAVLDNDTYYAVAVAAYDNLGNIGPLTAATCGTPQEVQDFYEEYRAQGGQAGGGCSVETRSRIAGFTGPATALLAGAAFLLRRRRRARTPKVRTSGDTQ